MVRRSADAIMAIKSRESAGKGLWSGLLFVASLLLVSVSGFDAQAQEFLCTPRKTCKQMRSCSEAVYRLRQCGDRERDGDNDGIPCESICGKTQAEMKRRLDAGF